MSISFDAQGEGLAIAQLQIKMLAHEANCKQNKHMQSFEQYLKDIHMSENPELDDDLPDDFDNWLGTLEQDIMIQYADDYAKECLRQAKELIEKGIDAKMQDTIEETGAYKYNWVYEECKEVVNDILK